MIDYKLILFWIFILAVLYFLGPTSIYLIGLIALICLLCSSCSSSVSTSIIRPNDINNFDISKMGNSYAIKPYSIPYSYSNQLGGTGSYIGNSIQDGFDMTPDEVYAAFADHPYNDENLGYGYYDGYDYVL